MPNMKDVHGVLICGIIATYVLHSRPYSHTYLVVFESTL